MKVTIRKAEQKDLPSLIKIEHQCFSPAERFPDNFLEFCLNEKDAILTLIASTKISKERSEDKVIGFIIAQRKTPLFYEIITIDVAPAYTRKGVGQQLMQRIEKEIKQWAKKDPGVAQLRQPTININIQLMVDENNLPAKKLYQKMDYQMISLVKNYYQNGNHAIRMVKIIQLDE
jgi:ribosomal protein S18 acetylase RimI-like enzyme